MRRGLYTLWIVGLCWIGIGTAEAQSQWNATEELRTPRLDHSSTLLQDGSVLVAGGTNNTVLNSAEIFDPKSGGWRFTGSMNHPRAGHVATLLGSGKVLVAGGRDVSSEGVVPVGSAEIYDPETETWTVVGDLIQARHRHTATLLPSGEVLVIGGRDRVGEANAGVLSTCEIFDPVTQTWRHGAPLLQGRSHFTATLLADGDVLAVGGYQNGTRLASIERYDWFADAWQSAGALLGPRQEHTATRLPSGEVLVAGGFGHANPQHVEIFDPARGTTARVADLPISRFAHDAVLLPTSQVLVVGGYFGGELLSSSFIYDPELDSWTRVDMTEPRAFHNAVLLPSGEVLATGGMGEDNTDLSSAEIFSAASGQWAETSDSLQVARAMHTATLLTDQTVLVTGGCPVPGNSQGCEEGALALLELYDPANATWSLLGDQLGAGRYGHTATRLHSGQVLIAGGRDDAAGAQIAAVLFDAAIGLLPAGFTEGRREATATLLADGRVLLVGGYRGGALSTVEIYDPTTNSWHPTGSLSHARGSHTATLLNTGEVLVVGGFDDDILMTAEVYDPVANTWRDTGQSSVGFLRHTATLLPSGKVLIAGGGDPFRAEIYDPATELWERTDEVPNLRMVDHAAALLPSGQVMLAGGLDPGMEVGTTVIYHPATDHWSLAPSLSEARALHTLTVLASGDVLATGGGFDIAVRSSEIFSFDDVDLGRRPVIESAPNQIGFGTPFQIIGSFQDGIEASGGTQANSSVNYPIFQLRNTNGTRLHTLEPDLRGDDATTLWDEPAVYSFSHLPVELNAGQYVLTATVAGVPSEPVAVEVTCGEQLIQSITVDPIGPIALGESLTLTATTQGVRHFQWLRNGVPIPGATAPSYTTPAATAADDGSIYQLLVGSGCAEEISEQIILRVEDLQPPQAQLLYPTGGERWALSTVGLPSTETISWNMSDNVRVCRVDLDLLYSVDNGVSFVEAFGNGLPVALGSGPGCRPDERVEQTAIDYTLPTSFPSGEEDSIYKVRLRVIDQNGNATETESPSPFFIVTPDGPFKTLILHHPDRMAEQLGDSSAGLEEVSQTLFTLANHPRVQGLIVDLGDFNDLQDLYAHWDASNTSEESVDRANQVLFGCHEPFPVGCPIDAQGDFTEKDGIHDVMLGIANIYPDLEHLVLVGDDRIIPMARLDDGATLLPESHYVDSGELTNTTPVGQALTSDTFLSDDPLATLDAAHLDDLHSSLFIPDLAVGRLVETPSEILTTLQIFLARDGQLNLAELDPFLGHKVQCTGYDFLNDVATKISQRWRQRFDNPPESSVTPVDSALIGQNWGAAGLAAHLCGNGGDPYGIINLNSHATHYQEGFPGFDTFDIQGISTNDLASENFCGPGQPLDLGGSIVYSVGCHSGLPVPGSDPGDADHSLDIAQTYLGRGAAIYIGNSGYGWGLVHGIGYSERLTDIFSDILSHAGNGLEVGDAVLQAKSAYGREARDPYAHKTLMQWTVFGLPMYSARLTDGESSLPPVDPPPQSLSELPTEETLPSGVHIQRQVVDNGEPLGGNTESPFLTNTNLHIDLSGSGIYQKFDANGQIVDPPIGCPTPDAGCYYAVSGAPDFAVAIPGLPIEPVLPVNTQLQSTSHHGTIWLGGTYVEEDNWSPLYAQLISNGATSVPLQTLPRKLRQLPLTSQPISGAGSSPCRSVDMEPTTLYLTVGELACGAVGCPDTIRHRLYEEIRVENLYFNNTEDPDANCDREGPELTSGFGSGAYHQIVGSSVEWAVQATDIAADVWRVVAVVDLEQGRWEPLELTRENDGIWRGSLSLPTGGALTYVLQAVDTRGNVTWVEWMPEDDPIGMDLHLADTIDVDVTPLPVDLALSLQTSQDPVIVGNTFNYLIEVQNLGPGTASLLELQIDLPPEILLNSIGGNGWDCATGVGSLACTFPMLEAGLSAPTLALVATAPGMPGSLMTTVSISAAQPDPVTANNVATIPVEVIAITDVGVTIDNDTDVVLVGESVSYVLTLSNQGPHAVEGAEVFVILPEGLENPLPADGTWSDLSLAPGELVVLTLAATVGADAQGFLSVTAQVDLPEGYVDLDLSNNTATDEDIVDQAPQLVFVSTVSDTGDGRLDAGEATEATLTQLHLHFSEALDDTTAADTDGYRLIEAGTDGVLQTEGCAALQGDDTAFAIDEAQSLTPETVALWIHNGVPLPRGRYGLWVCDSITDVSGNGIAETAWDFSVTAQHRLQASNFDDASTLEIWGVGVEPPDAVVFSPDDVGDAVTSGSALLSGGTDGITLFQCADLAWSNSVEIGGWTRVEAPGVDQPTLLAVLELFPQADCSGDPVEDVMWTLQVGATEGMWMDLPTQRFTLPQAVGSVQITFRAQSDGDDFDLWLDDLYLKLIPLHSDGFESGDTSMWSNTVP